MKKLLYVVLMSVIVFTLLFGTSACGTKTQNGDNSTTAGTTKAAEPTVDSKAPTPLTLALQKHPDDNLDTNAPYFKLLEEATNTKLTIIPLPQETLDEKRNVLLASGQVFDLLSVNSSMANLYGPEGIFAELDKLIDENAPNLKEKGILDKKSSFSKRSTDGKLYMIPRYYEGSTVVMNGIIYREDYLKEVGLSEPTTMDEWYNAFKAVKAKHPEVTPLVQKDMYDTARPVLGSNWDMGLIDGGFGVIGARMGENKIEFLNTTDNYKDFLTYLNRLYKEKLLDNEYVTMTYQQWTEKIASQKTFAYLSNVFRAVWGTDEAKKVGNDIKYIMSETPLGSTGKRQTFGMPDPWLDGMAVYAKSKYQKEAVQFLDYLFGKEGSDSYYFGIEGETFKMENGKQVVTDTTPKWWEMRAKIGFGNNIPRYDSLLTIFGDLDAQPVVKDGLEKNTPYMVGIPWLNRSKEDQDTWNGLSAAIDTYSRTVFDQLIIGKESFDNWDKIKAEYEKLQVSKGVEIMQRAYDIYLNAIK
ncbi:MAG: extracellular solute-binding protein [Ruminiclostridium sp.]|nr:extracellular solute-binding protein [Ruminiclostridium sp.]